MIEQRASVVAVRSGTAVVETSSATHCEACAAGRGCGAGLFARLLTRRVTRLEVANQLDVKPGQAVIIGVEEAELARASLRLYGTFLLALLLGAALGHAVALALGWPADLVSASGGISALMLAIIPFKRKPAGIAARLLARCDPAGNHSED